MYPAETIDHHVLTRSEIKVYWSRRSFNGLTPQSIYVYCSQHKLSERPPSSGRELVFHCPPHTAPLIREQLNTCVVTMPNPSLGTWTVSPYKLPLSARTQGILCYKENSFTSYSRSLLLGCCLTNHPCCTTYMNQGCTSPIHFFLTVHKKRSSTDEKVYLSTRMCFVLPWTHQACGCSKLH